MIILAPVSQIKKARGQLLSSSNYLDIIIKTQLRIFTRYTRVLCTRHISHHWDTSPCVGWGWGVSANFLRHPTLLTQISDTQIPGPCCPDTGWCLGCSRSEQLRSRVAVWWPAPATQAVTRVIRVSVQSRLSDFKQLQTPTRLLQTVICRDTPSQWSALSSVGQVWTCWAWNKVVQFTQQGQ